VACAGSGPACEHVHLLLGGEGGREILEEKNDLGFWRGYFVSNT